MKLLLITYDITLVGGIERVINKLTNYLCEHFNYDIEIVSLNQNNLNGYNPYFQYNSNIKLTFLDLENKRYVTNNKFQSLLVILKNYCVYKKEVRRLLERRKVDIVLTFHAPLSIVTILNKKYIHGKLIVTEHSEYENGPDKIGKILRRLLFKKADRVIVLTEESRNIYQKFTNNLRVIPNPISFTTEEYSSLSFKRVICAGRLEIEKGFDQIIRAFSMIHKENKDWVMDIFGEGSERNRLIDLINDLKLNHFVNIKPFSKDIKKEFLCSDIFVLPSRSEAFPLTLLEAMECGLPCLSFDLPGPREIIKHRNDGIIVEKENINQLAKELNHLIKNSDIRIKYGFNAKKNVRRYHIDKICNIWRETFLEL